MAKRPQERIDMRGPPVRDLGNAGLEAFWVQAADDQRVRYLGVPVSLNVAVDLGPHGGCKGRARVGRPALAVQDPSTQDNIADTTDFLDRSE